MVLITPPKPAPDVQLLAFGPYVMDAQTRVFRTAGGLQHRCSRREFDVLQRLMLARGRRIPLDRLALQVYRGDDSRDPTVLRTIICSLNRKLRAAGFGAVVGNQREIGYFLQGGEAPADVLVLEPASRQALDRVMQHAATALPDEVQLLREQLAA